MAPSKTADTKSILFIHSIRRDRPTKVHREDEVFGKFCLNKCEGKTSGAQVKKANCAQGVEQALQRPPSLQATARQAGLPRHSEAKAGKVNRSGFQAQHGCK